jgi:hypothetical protein
MACMNCTWARVYPGDSCLGFCCGLRVCRPGTSVLRDDRVFCGS